MVPEVDIWRAANLLIHQHGADAVFAAAQRADLMLDRRDGEGWVLWLRIRQAIKALQAPRQGELH
ncbi:MAG TPA: hypothetical protein VGR45_18745 [Stellaceae bacterium]|nr:hypothetical protein [Stellaceae bacterium]